LTDLGGDYLLVRRAAGGDAVAFGRLVDRYSGTLQQFITHRTHQPDDVEDLVQEVFCRAWEGLPYLRRPDRFASWLLSLAANRVVSQWRRRTAARSRTAQLTSGAGRSVQQPDEEFAQRQTQARVQQAVEALPPEYRRTIVLRYFEGYPVHQVARLLGISLAVAKRRVKLGRRWLRRLVLAATLPTGPGRTNRRHGAADRSTSRGL
jgi:RNA polymerase sigma-70 factor (ECF subfamily)